MTPKCAAALRREFGYVPNDRRGERWVVYQGAVLIVTHPDDRPKLYYRDGSGSPVEIEPLRHWVEIEPPQP